MFEGITIGVLSVVISGFLVFFIVSVARLWHTPKRLDRIELVLPVIARGIWALLGEHVRESNGETSQEIKDVYSELTDVVTKGIVSQKANK